MSHLTQFYAITDKHLMRYHELVDQIISCNEEIEKMIEFWGDDLVISRTGTDLPRIHKVGAIIQDRSATKPGVATFTLNGFLDKRKKIIQLLNLVSNQN